MSNVVRFPSAAPNEPQKDEPQDAPVKIPAVYFLLGAVIVASLIALWLIA